MSSELGSPRSPGYIGCMQTVIAASTFDPATWERLSDAAFWRLFIVSARRMLIADLPWIVPLAIAWWTVGLYVLKPIFLHRNYRERTVPHLLPFDPVSSPPPVELAALFDAAIEELKELGFAVTARIACADDGIGFYVILTNREERMLGVVAAMQPVHRRRASRRRTPELHLGFETRLAEGCELGTTNRPVPLCFGYPPHARVKVLPGVKSPAVLYRLHRRSVEELKPSEVGELPQLEDPIGWLRDETITQSAWEISSGFLYTEPSGEYHRLTWKGAILLSWTELWPVNNVRRALARRRARRLLVQWGFHEPAA